MTTYELIYPDGQENVKVSLSEAHVVASRFVEKHIEHEKQTYAVKKAIFDPTRGIVVTTITGETFVHVGLKEAAKRVPPPRAKAKGEATLSRRGKPLKCTCGKCKTCYQREYMWKKDRKTKTRKKSHKAKRQKRAAPKRIARISGISEENVRKGIAAMFKSGMTFMEIAEIFEVPTEAIESLIREAI